MFHSAWNGIQKQNSAPVSVENAWTLFALRSCRYAQSEIGDLRNKARKDAANAVIQDRKDREAHGWTVFHFDFNAKLMRRDLTLGEAIRYLMRVTGTRVGWWRCPERGLAAKITVLRKTPFSYEKETTYRRLAFSTALDEIAAKKELTADLLIGGIDLYRGLPNPAFESQVRILRNLLEAGPAVGAEEWNALKAKLQDKTQPLLHTPPARALGAYLGQVLWRPAPQHRA